MRNSWITLSALAAVLVLLTGCTRGVEIAPVVTSRPAETAEPEPLQELFGGDCSTVLTSTALTELLDVEMLQSAASADPTYGAVGSVGGLRCTWASGLEPGTTLSLLILPFALKGSYVQENYCGVVGLAVGVESTSCIFDVSHDGAWISGSLTQTPAVSDAIGAARVAAIDALLTSVATSANSVVPRLSVADAQWALDTNCAALEQVADVAAAVDSPSLRAAPGNSFTDGEIVAYGAVIRASGVVSCWWAPDTYPVPDGQVNGVSVVLVPGGAWFGRQLDSAPGAVRVDVDGADVAAVLSSDSQQSPNGLVVTAGSNLLFVSSMYTDEPVERLFGAVRPLVDALDAAR